MIQSRKIVSRSHQEKESDEVKLALHHYGLSRLFAASLHPSLSSSNIHLAKIIISQQDRGPGIDLSSSSSSSRIISHRSGGHVNRDGQIHHFDADDEIMMPNWQQIHNRQCRICENVLLLGLNCRSIKEDGIECGVCGTKLIRSKADQENKRLYRSIKVRKSLKTAVEDNIANGKKRKRSSTLNEAQEEDSIGLEAATQEEQHVSVKIEPLTLEEKRAEMKRKAKEEKKKEKSKQEPKKINWLSDQNTSKDSKDANVTIMNSKPLSDKDIRAASRAARKARKAEIHQMLSEVRAKKDNEKKSQSQQGGLQDFLGSI